MLTEIRRDGRAVVGPSTSFRPRRRSEVGPQDDARRHLAKAEGSTKPRDVRLHETQRRVDGWPGVSDLEPTDRRQALPGRTERGRHGESPGHRLIEIFARMVSQNGRTIAFKDMRGLRVLPQTLLIYYRGGMSPSVLERRPAIAGRVMADVCRICPPSMNGSTTR